MNCLNITHLEGHLVSFSALYHLKIKTLHLTTSCFMWKSWECSSLFFHSLYMLLIVTPPAYQVIFVSNHKSLILLTWVTSRKRCLSEPSDVACGLSPDLGTTGNEWLIDWPIHMNAQQGQLGKKKDHQPLHSRVLCQQKLADKPTSLPEKASKSC